MLKSQFQSVVTAQQLQSLIVKKNPGKFKATAALRLPATPTIGLSFYPPMNCNPTIVAPPVSARIKFTAAATPLPAAFNWGDNDNVSAAKQWQKRDTPYIVSPPNQLSCGSCWAVAAASVFSDRWAIFTQGPNPNLSATDIISCVSDGSNSSVSNSDVNFGGIDGCNGGIPAGAAELFALYGVVNSNCSSYDWCANNAVCNGQQQANGDPGTYLNTHALPACAIAKKCTNKGATPTVFKAARYNPSSYNTSSKLSTTALVVPKGGKKFTVTSVNPTTTAALSITSIPDIKLEIFNNGPVVGAMAVFADFQAGSNSALGGDDWARTKNVYCNVQQGNPRPYNGTGYQGTESALQGYHAVSIVGWGVETGVPDWMAPGKTFDLPYWIVRNSWSTQWNKGCVVNGVPMPGFVKIAMTDVLRNINTEVYLDRANALGNLGGATAFQPDVQRVTPPPKNPVRGDAPTTLQFGFDSATKTCGSGSQYATMDDCLLDHKSDIQAICQDDGQCKVDVHGTQSYADCMASCRAVGPQPVVPAFGYDATTKTCGSGKQYVDMDDCVLDHMSDVRASCNKDTGNCSLDVNGTQSYAECLASCRVGPEPGPVLPPLVFGYNPETKQCGSGSQYISMAECVKHHENDLRATCVNNSRCVLDVYGAKTLKECKDSCGKKQKLTTRTILQITGLSACLLLVIILVALCIARR